MRTPTFTGVGVALLTFFHEDGSLDAPATAQHARQLVETGMKAIIVTGSTGEPSSLDEGERDELWAAVRTALADTPSVPMVAGTGAPSIRQCVALTRRAVAQGADGILALSPRGPIDAVRYYQAVIEAAGDVPVLAYHYPEVSPPGLRIDQLKELSEQGIAGCKDSSGDAERLLLTLVAWDAPLYTGSSALLSTAGPLGCAGAILALANACPELCAQAFLGDPEAQRSLGPFHEAASRQFPAVLKELTAKRFSTPLGCRLA